MKSNSPRLIPSLLVLGFLIVGNSLITTNATNKSSSDTHAVIDAYMAERMHTLKIPGAALAIVQGDQIEYSQGYGVADTTGRAVTPQTPFLLASLSKSFTALAIMQLAEDNKLELDAPVQKYLPWFQIADKKASSEITVRQLINQTSGFSEIDGRKLTLDSNMAADALVASMKQLTTTKLVSSPGTTYQYSNINYGLLGAIVEAVSGHSYDTYVEQNIFAPLDMKHSYTSLSAARAGGMARGYYPFFGIPIIYDNLMPFSTALTPMGGLFSSAEDMAHYMIAQLNNGRYAGAAVLSAAGTAALHDPGVMLDKWWGYAMGWNVGPDFDLPSRDPLDKLSGYTIPVEIYHQGAYIAFRTVVLMIPQQKVGVIVLMNTDDPAIESAFGWLGWDVASIYLGVQPSHQPPAESFTLQHIRLILIGFNIFLLASFIWFIRKLRSWRHAPMATRPRWYKLLGYMVVPLAIDVLLVWFLLAYQLPQARATVMLTLRGAPDIGLLIVLVLLFSIGWGAVRTVLTLQIIFRKVSKT